MNDMLVNDSKSFLKHIKFASNITKCIILDGHTSLHTISCTKFSKDLLVMCAISKCIRYIKGDMLIVINQNFYIIHHTSLKVTIT